MPMYVLLVTHPSVHAVDTWVFLCGQGGSLPGYEPLLRRDESREFTEHIVHRAETDNWGKEECHWLIVPVRGPLVKQGNQDLGIW
jgi:hypothetical protein